jgi:hypothetical protein
VIDDKSKERKKYRYEDMKTPYDKLKSLDNAEQHLKKGGTFKKLMHRQQRSVIMKLRGSYKLPKLNFLTPSLDEKNRLDKR